MNKNKHDKSMVLKEQETLTTMFIVRNIAPDAVSCGKNSLEQGING
ncbi:MAG: hypothetical protein M8357_04925 [Desulfobulbaceae bacterium]|nr:hypothetical protein [Desulfobulbaceae bacterium]